MAADLSEPAGQGERVYILQAEGATGGFPTLRASCTRPAPAGSERSAAEVCHVA